MSALARDLNLCGWGFAPGSDIQRAVNPPEAATERSRRIGACAFVSRIMLAEWMATRSTVPSRAEVMMRWRCSRAAAYRYRVVCEEIMTKRCKVCALEGCEQ